LTYTEDVTKSLLLDSMVPPEVKGDVIISPREVETVKFWSVFETPRGVGDI
jgi:hypothetical protein